MKCAPEHVHVHKKTHASFRSSRQHQTKAARRSERVRRVAVTVEGAASKLQGPFSRSLRPHTYHGGCLRVSPFVTAWSFFSSRHNHRVVCRVCELFACLRRCYGGMFTLPVVGAGFRIKNTTTATTRKKDSSASTMMPALYPSTFTPLLVTTTTGAGAADGSGVGDIIANSEARVRICDLRKKLVFIAVKMARSSTRTEGRSVTDGPPTAAS
jgi:hypothetical protein